MHLGLGCYKFIYTDLLIAIVLDDENALSFRLSVDIGDRFLVAVEC